MANPQLAPAISTAALVLVGCLGVVFVAGFVVLAALGHDVSTYLLFLGGPAVTAIVGAIVGQRVQQASAAASSLSRLSNDRLTRSVVAVDDHLSAQDHQLGVITSGVYGAEAPPPRTPPVIPISRRAPNR